MLEICLKFLHFLNIQSKAFWHKYVFLSSLSLVPFQSPTPETRWPSTGSAPTLSRTGTNPAAWRCPPSSRTTTPTSSTTRPSTVTRSMAGEATTAVWRWGSTSRETSGSTTQPSSCQVLSLLSNTDRMPAFYIAMIVIGSTSQTN